LKSRITTLGFDCFGFIDGGGGSYDGGGGSYDGGGGLDGSGVFLLFLLRLQNFLYITPINEVMRTSNMNCKIKLII